MIIYIVNSNVIMYCFMILLLSSYKVRNIVNYILFELTTCKDGNTYMLLKYSVLYLLVMVYYYDININH